MDLTELLTKLSQTDAPSGFEAPAANLAAELLRPYADEVKIDALGSVIAIRRCGKADAKRVLIDAHIDEIGFIVTGYEGGFLRFAPLGGVDARILPASAMKILTEPPVFGVVDVLPPHVQASGDADKALKIEDLYIDTGFAPDEVEAQIPVGTAAVFASSPTALGGHFTAKAFDDRACFAAVILALEELGDAKSDFDLIVTATSQEEVGRRSAAAAAFEFAPDYAIIVDVDHAKTPDSKAHQGKPIGSGVVIARGVNMNRAFTDRLTEIARARGIPHTISVEPGDSGTNARVLQTVRAGVATALLGVPLKYMHSPSETLALSDVEALGHLLCAALKECDFNA
ncbi:MAG: M20/M25/M40 family metallo-hydrolase [Oscillospiraceae bacterium]|jgi:endoglucanase|nr:M20/M25/M40 family metallo-hydrolase [Oscillospiraceae bacterium]